MPTSTTHVDQRFPTIPDLPALTQWNPKDHQWTASQTVDLAQSLYQNEAWAKAHFEPKSDENEQTLRYWNKFYSMKILQKVRNAEEGNLKGKIKPTEWIEKMLANGYIVRISTPIGATSTTLRPTDLWGDETPVAERLIWMSEYRSISQIPRNALERRTWQYYKNSGDYEWYWTYYNLWLKYAPGAQGAGYRLVRSELESSHTPDSDEDWEMVDNGENSRMGSRKRKTERQGVRIRKRPLTSSMNNGESSFSRLPLANRRGGTSDQPLIIDDSDDETQPSPAKPSLSSRITPSAAVRDRSISSSSVVIFDRSHLSEPIYSGPSPQGPRFSSSSSATSATSSKTNSSSHSSASPPQPATPEESPDDFLQILYPRKPSHLLSQPSLAPRDDSSSVDSPPTSPEISGGELPVSMSAKARGKRRWKEGGEEEAILMDGIILDPAGQPPALGFDMPTSASEAIRPVIDLDSGPSDALEQPPSPPLPFEVVSPTYSSKIDLPIVNSPGHRQEDALAIDGSDLEPAIQSEERSPARDAEGFLQNLKASLAALDNI